jgi:hypothetical protein
MRALREVKKESARPPRDDHQTFGQRVLAAPAQIGIAEPPNSIRLTNDERFELVD